MVREYDVVRIVKLNKIGRHYQGTQNVRRAPQIGDTAVIVYLYDPNDPKAPVICEALDEGGYTIWLADFEPDEFEVIHRAST